MILEKINFYKCNENSRLLVLNTQRFFYQFGFLFFNLAIDISYQKS